MTNLRLLQRLIGVSLGKVTFKKAVSEIGFTNLERLARWVT